MQLLHLHASQHENIPFMHLNYGCMHAGATFFPAALHPVIDRVAGLCSQVFRAGLQPAAARSESGSSLPLNGAPLPGSDNAEAARGVP